MTVPTDSQWAQYSALCQHLRPLSASERQAEIDNLWAAGEADPQVLQLVARFFALPPDPARNRSGERIGDYTLEERLGQGGMGEVYRAKQHFGDEWRPVAVKLIRPFWLSTAHEEALARFGAELHALVALEHRGIARIYAGGISEDPRTQERLPYIAMALVHSGQPLTTYAETYNLSLPERLDLFVRVCDAVQYAHERRIIHCDLKPANVLVNGTEGPVVIDFGLAHVYEAICLGASMIVGTPAYMSPEQVSAAMGGISEKSDVYALGVILYELLTGHRPYEVPPHGSPEQWRQVILEAKSPPLRQYRKTYHRELEAVLAAALAKRPDDRLTLDTLRCRIRRYLNARRRPHPVWGALVVGLFVVVMLGRVLFPPRDGEVPKLVERHVPVAQTLSGMIWDDDHQLLAGVEVWLSDVNRTVTTDQHGHFTFTDIHAPQRDVRLLARKEGYSPYDAYATLGDPAFTIRMRKQP